MASAGEQSLAHRTFDLDSMLVAEAHDFADDRVGGAAERQYGMRCPVLQSDGSIYDNHRTRRSMHDPDARAAPPPGDRRCDFVARTMQPHIRFSIADAQAAN